MKKILILGGCGYIGSRLFQHLQAKNYPIDTVDLEWFGNRVNPHNIKKDFKDLTKAFFKKYDVVILLAGHSSVQMCINNMVPAFKNNVENFVYLLDKLDDQKFIYASSSSIYGNTEELLVNEAYDRYTPNNYYDLTKKEIDYYAHLSSKNYFGLRLATVNGYSPNFRSDLMINKMFVHAKKHKTIDLFNMHAYRPILGIDDLCRAIERIIEKDGERGIYNLASFNSTIGNLGKEVARLMTGITLLTHEEKTSYLYSFSIDTKKFETEFDFTFSDTVKTIVESIKKNYNNLYASERK